MQRPFTSGSRQAPDPFDQFLEEHNYYRKHTARDASCLFRVISEQMYDTQLHHLSIRKKCVSYMRKHYDFFQQLVDRDLDEYLDDLSKPKTYGTLVELQAVGYMFQRNVLLFQPFDLGNYYTSRSYFTEVFRVFYTPERHFDSVFTCDYIKDAAICQSICYEILYKDLYKLPDVSFAVEQMLHATTFEGTECRSECNEDGYCTKIHLSDGRSFDLDLPSNTCCILENYKLCHFHYTNFPRLSDDLQREMNTYNNCGDEEDKNVLNKTAESLLPDKFISCVRQLLHEGITPFPYKVAKALDPNMYRNIEFDSWNEARKELKLQNWYNGDTNFKVGAKCHVKLRKSEKDLYTCHIQEIAVDKGYCVVFIEQLGEKRLVPYDSLTPLPPDQFKPWTLPYRLQRHMQKYSSFRYTRHYNYRYCSALPAIKSEYYNMVEDDGKQSYSSASPTSNHHSSCFYKLKQYTHLENFRTQTVEYCAMPLTVEHNTNRDHDAKGQRSSQTVNDSSRAPSRSSVNTGDGQNKQESLANGVEDAANNCDAGTVVMEQYDMENGGYLPEMQCFYPVPPYGGMEEYYSYGYDGSMHPTALMPANAGGTFYYTCAPSYPQPNNLFMQAPPPQPPHPLITTGPGGPAHAGGYYPTPYYSSTIVPASVAPPAPLNTPVTTHNLTPSARGRGSGSTTPLTGRINWEAKKSTKANGMDLPTDVATLRYFYNLGLDYHNKHLKPRGNSEDSTNDIKDNIGKLANDVQNIKLDENANQQEPKSDSNNNNMTANPNVNSTSITPQIQNSGSGKSNPQQQRRFPSRYFNSKERQSYQRHGGTGSNLGSGQQNRSHQTDYNKNPMGQSKQGNTGSTNSRNQAQNSNMTSNCSGNGGHTPLLNVTEQGIQTSPMIAYDGSNMGKDNAQTPTTIYNPNHNPFITYGSYDFPAEQSGQSTQFGPPPPAGGMYIQMPMAPTPYGIYTAPPPVGMHPAPGAYPPPYMGPPPSGSSPMHGPHQTLAPPPPPGQPTANGFYSTPTGPEPVENNGAVDGGVHFQCMGYPPPMPFYYSPTTTPVSGGGGSNVNTPNVGVAGPPPANIGQQGYWCVPSSMPLGQPSQTNGSTVGAGSGPGNVVQNTPVNVAVTHNRRDKPTNE